MSLMPLQQAHKIWLQAAEKVKDRVINPTLFRAIELGHGITLDGETFILGFTIADMPMASILRSGQNLLLLEQCVSEVLRNKVRVIIIDGTTLADYDAYKKQLEIREQTVTQLSSRRDDERAVQLAWDEVGEQIARTHARMNLRQLPQIRAQFINEGFRIINEAIERLGYTEDSDELQKRSLARVFEKFATVTEVPGAMLAYEFFKLREEGRLK